MAASTTRRTFLQGAAGLSALSLGAVSWRQAVAQTAAASPPKIKVGQIGTGHSHATKLEVYRRSPDYEVVGIVEPDAQLRDRAQGNAAYQDLNWMTEEQLLNQPGLQVVLVETRVRNLLDTAERCVAAGKHLHLDKPAGESFSQYQRLLAAAAERRLLVQMGYMFRYNPAVLLLRQFLREGWLGEVFQVDAVISSQLSENNRRVPAAYPGGIMFELGSHIVDLLVGALGKPDRVQSVARHSSAVDDKLLDNMLAVCDYPRAIATLKSTAVEVSARERRNLIVCGTAGTFAIQPIEQPKVRYSLDRDRGEYSKGTHEISFEPYKRYVADAADMAKIIRGEKACDFPYSHDLAVQDTLLRASGLPVS